MDRTSFTNKGLQEKTEKKYTEMNNEDFNKLVDRSIEYITHDQDMDTVSQRCDENIRPIYPTRYGYWNIFEEPPLDPAPSIHSLLSPDASWNMRLTKGYAARVLRHGWVYIKEEEPIKTRGTDQDGRLLIFKYQSRYVEVRKKNGMLEKGAMENFIEYERKANSLSWEEIQTARGYRGIGDPFIPLDKNISRISIVYSEVPLAANVLEKIDTNKEFRKEAMQLVDLDDTESLYSIDLTESNLNSLIEYWTEEEKFHRFINRVMKAGDTSLAPADLWNMATQITRDMEASMIMRHLNRLLCPYYKDKAKIVILYDPVGCQRDILQAHTAISAWHLNYMATHIYPITIGSFIERLESKYQVPRNGDLEEFYEFRKQFYGSINKEDWKDLWPNLKETEKYSAYKKGLYARIALLFAEKPGVADALGGLAHYFKYFFSVADEKKVFLECDAEEFYVYCKLWCELIAPLYISDEGKRVITNLLGGELATDTSSSWYVVCNGIVNTLAHDGVKKNQIISTVTEGIDLILNTLGEVIAQFFVFGTRWIGKNAGELYGKSIEQITNKLIPKCLAILNIEMLKGKYVELTGKEFRDFIGGFEKTIQNGDLRNIKNNINNFGSGLKGMRGKAVFNWSQRLDEYANKWNVKIPIVKLNGPELGFKLMRYANQSLSVLLNGSLVGLDLFMKSYTIYTLLSQSSFERNAPLKPSNSIPLYFVATFTNAVIGGLIAAKGFSELGGKALTAMEKLVEKLNKPVQGSVLSSASSKFILDGKSILKITKAGIVTTGFLSALLSYYDASSAFDLGNTGEAYSHIAMGTGSGVMALTWLMGAAEGGGVVIGWNPYFWVGVSLVAIGTAGILLFSKTDLENLLQNCFWGNGKKYSFWDKYNDRLSLKNQFEIAMKMEETTRNSFLVERQEFRNLFMMRPTLKIDKNKKGKVTYNFMLPGFQWGKSDFFYEISLSDKIRRYNLPHFRINNYKTDHDKIQNDNYIKAKDKFESLLKSEFLKLEESGIDGTVTLSIEIDFFDYQYLKVFWYYMPTEDSVLPIRYKWGEEPSIENAIYGYINEELR